MRIYQHDEENFPARTKEVLPDPVKDPISLKHNDYQLIQ
jgi:hypothetical protein